jgi:hypothetical protein
MVCRLLLFEIGFSSALCVRRSVEVVNLFQSVHDHRQALEADAARFRNASADSRQKLVAINKRFSEDKDTGNRRRNPSEKHVNFPETIAVDVLPPPPSCIDRSISVPSA